MRYSLTYDRVENELSIDIPVEEILYSVAKSSVLSEEQIREILQNPGNFMRRMMDSLSSDVSSDTLIEQMIEQAISQTVGDDI